MKNQSNLMHVDQNYTIQPKMIQKPPTKNEEFYYRDHNSFNFISEDSSVGGSSRGSGYFTDESFNQFHLKKLQYETILSSCKLIYVAMLLLSIIWLMISLIYLKPPLHCLASSVVLLF